MTKINNIIALYPLILLAVCIFVYSNTMHRTFMIDDHSIYTETELGGKNIIGYFNPVARVGSDPNDIHSKTTYRPLTYAIWTMTYRWFGSNPVGYHVFNLSIFWLTCYVLFIFVFSYTGRHIQAIAASLIFSVHPFQGIMMNNLPTILVAFETMFMLLGMVFLKFGLERSTLRPVWNILSFVMVFSSLLIHETAVAFPAYLICALIFGLGYRPVKALNVTIPFAVMSAVYVVLRLSFTNLKSGLWDQAHFFKLDLLQYLATFPHLIGWYFKQLVSPMGVVMIMTVPIVKSGYLINILGLMSVLLISLVIFIRSSDKMIRWCISWFVIGFAPVSLACLFRLSDGLCLESLWLIFPSIGYFLVLGYFFESIWESRRIFAIVFLVALVMSLATASRIYNKIWSDEKFYSIYALEKSPAYRAGYFWLGNTFLREGNYNLARHYLPLGLDSKVFNRQIYNNLGIMDFNENRWESAEKNFKAAVTENPQHSLAYEYLGRIALARGDHQIAREFFLRTVELSPRDTVARLGLATIEYNAGRKENAIGYYKDNLRARPHDGDTLLALLRFYVSEQSNSSSIIETAQEILEFTSNAVLLTSAAEVLAQANYTPLAGKMFERSLAVDPLYKQTYLSFGKFLGNLGRFDDAIRTWQDGARLDPQDAQFRSLIEQAQILKKDLKQR